MSAKKRKEYEEVNKEPFIHLFSCSTGYYLYDVNTDSILKVTPDTYQRLEKRENIEENEQIRKFKEIWVLKNLHMSKYQSTRSRNFCHRCTKIESGISLYR